MKKPVHLFVLLQLLIPVLVNGQQIAVQLEGDTNFNNNLIQISEAGDDYSSSILAQFSVYVSVINNDPVNKMNPNYRWRIFVHKLDMEWHNKLQLETRRAGNGIRPGNPGTIHINDGESFQQITNIPVYFFGGRGEIVQIPVSLKMSGFSVAMGARDFETTLVFTVYDD
jgi:hypothetical protein